MQCSLKAFQSFVAIVAIAVVVFIIVEIFMKSSLHYNDNSLFMHMNALIANMYMYIYPGTYKYINLHIYMCFKLPVIFCNTCI